MRATERLAYPLDEVGALCGGVCVRTVYNWIEAGDLKAIRIGGRRLVLKEDLNAFLAASRVAA
jgi:excisionase family DNA binding protein